jgi:hypothetical protein
MAFTGIVYTGKSQPAPCFCRYTNQPPSDQNRKTLENYEIVSIAPTQPAPVSHTLPRPLKTAFLDATPTVFLNTALLTPHCPLACNCLLSLHHERKDLRKI